MFKALRSIAENLFDEDDKYRILYADNKKVQQRILSRIGGYECKLDPAKENNMETDAGLCETEGHFKQKRETFHANASRKRSLSWPAKEQMEKEKKQHAFIHKNTNYYKHQYTLPPKQSKTTKQETGGARKKAYTQDNDLDCKNTNGHTPLRPSVVFCL
eukprot:913500_1